MTTDTDRSAAGDAQPADHETALLRQELQTLQRRLQTLEEILAWQYLPSPLGPPPPDGGPPHDYLSLAAIVRDEGPYLREWLSYHRLIGVERFYIYDNESRDDTRKLLEPWIERGLVIYRYVAGSRMQMPAYSDAVYSARFTTQWLALLDADEFLVPLCSDDLRRFLRGFEKHPALGINWIMFDSNGHDQPPTAHGGLVTANYTRVHRSCHDGDAGKRHVKSIVNPREVMAVLNAHYAVYRFRQPAVNELHQPFYGPYTPRHSTTCIQCNHYYSRSRQEYLRKVGLARADNGKMRVFDEEVVNFPDPAEDQAILRFVPRLQECLARDWD